MAHEMIPSRALRGLLYRKDNDGMTFHGFQKMTLLDFPGKVACTLFTGGCNFRCPFCHNAGLVLNPGLGESYTVEEILAFLKKRQGLLDGVCITGGEPLLNPDLADFMREVRELGFLIKLDTNGSFPDRLQDMVAEGLVDYVAMDIKNCPAKYSETVGISDYDVTPIRESVSFLLSGAVDFEFRTTVVREFHTVEDIQDIGAWIAGAPRYFLQNFVDSGALIGQNLHSVGPDVLVQMQKSLVKYGIPVELRGL